MSGGVFDSVTGIYWVEARVPNTIYPTMQDSLTRNINSAEAEKSRLVGGPFSSTTASVRHNP
jgi:hypothetical protein